MKAPRVLLAALLGLTVLGAGACGNSETLSTAPRTPAAQGSLIGGLVKPTGLLRCSPLPADSISVLVGPDGGTIYVGPHALVIPAGALQDTVTITAVAPSDTVNRVRLKPAGLAFERTASLTMSYANCNLLGWLLPKAIADVDAGLSILSYLQSVDSFLSQAVTGRVQVFPETSDEYAIAW